MNKKEFDNLWDDIKIKYSKSDNRFFPNLDPTFPAKNPTWKYRMKWGIEVWFENNTLIFQTAPGQPSFPQVIIDRQTLLNYFEGDVNALLNLMSNPNTWHPWFRRIKSVISQMWFDCTPISKEKKKE